MISRKNNRQKKRLTPLFMTEIAVEVAELHFSAVQILKWLPDLESKCVFPGYWVIMCYWNLVIGVYRILSQSLKDGKGQLVKDYVIY